MVAVVLTVWGIIAATMPEPKWLETRELRVGRQPPPQAQQLAHQLETVPGVREAVVIADEGVAYLKVDTDTLDERALNKYLAAV